MDENPYKSPDQRGSPVQRKISRWTSRPSLRDLRVMLIIKGIIWAVVLSVVGLMAVFRIVGLLQN
jgi:hypothetical protein